MELVRTGWSQLEPVPPPCTPVTVTARQELPLARGAPPTSRGSGLSDLGWEQQQPFVSWDGGAPAASPMGPLEGSQLVGVWEATESCHQL